MKKQNLENLETITGGLTTLTNRSCTILGALALASMIALQWGPTVALTATAAVGGCFD